MPKSTKDCYQNNYNPSSQKSVSTRNFAIIYISMTIIAILQNARKQADLKYSFTDAFLEIDILIPTLQLCFEFQVLCPALF